MENSGTVFDISRFCLNDGPGIRTTVFLKGCPLRCAWCHNPESQRTQPEIMFDPKRCKLCGACAAVCEGKLHTITDAHAFNRAACTGCGKCVSVCRTESLRLAGKVRSVDEVMKEVLRDKVFYEESGGGLTVSGGEPLLQHDFLHALLSRAKQEGIHTCVETCGFAPEAVIEKIAPLVDIFLFDWKESDPERHRAFTGVDNSRIRRNLEYLCNSGAEIVLRLPFIPGYNADDSHISGIAALANSLPAIKRMEIMPYHPLGISKEKELGRDTSERTEPTIPDKQILDSVLEKLRACVTADVQLSI